MNSKHVFRAFLTAGTILASAYTGHSKTISANGTYEGEVAFLNSYGNITYKGATFKVKVPKGVKAEISVRSITGSAWGCAGFMRAAFFGGDTAVKMMAGGCQPYVTTVSKETSISLVPWVAAVNDSYDKYRVDMPNGTVLWLPTGGKVGSYSVTEKYSVRVTYLRQVKFYGNGGSLSYTKWYHADGQIYEHFPVATRKGYRLLGWYTKKSGGKRVDFLTKSSSKVTKLYAHWARARYQVRFDANQGTGKMANEKFVYGKSKALSANAFKRSGYTFAGWARNPTGAVKYKNKQKVKKLASKDGSVVVLYAKWKAKPAKKAKKK